ncbi:hypothetical protein GGI17_003198 [Coemansia sp. S146]|nr:hypothetical protein GGI17_003198 [Coemansia sp. S146]
MSQSDWETDSEYRQFRPGRYAMRQLGRSVSRRTKLLLQPTQNAHNDLELHAVEHSGGAAAYRRGPPLPSGIHRRSVSFDNLPMFPDSVRRSSTEPGLSTEPTSPSLGLPAASTWNSGTVTTKSGKSPRSTYSHGGVSRRAWLPGLAHPLSTAIHLESSAQQQQQLAVATGGLSSHANRESFSGAAQLDASTHMSNSPRSPLHGSDPFQNRHLWISEEDLALEAHESQAPHVTFQAVQITASVPVGSGLLRGSSQGSQAASGARKLGNIARVISNISRKLHRMRSQRSASQPATPAEVRQSILDSARQNMIHVPNDPAHDFYRFFVNPADPVSDRESSTADSPTISRHASSGHTRRRRSDALTANATILPPAALAADAGADMGGGSLPPVGPTSPVFSNESLDRLYESISRAPSGTPVGASVSSHRRSASDGGAVYSIRESRAFLTNQGHNGSVSELVLAKLESEFVDNVRVSTRLAMDLSTESSYGTFVRFHNSGELSGIFAADRAQKQPTPMMQQGPDSAESPPQPGPEERIPARYARNHDNISRFVDEVRAVRQDSAQRQVEALGRQQVLDNNQALLDAALHIYERQQRYAAEARHHEPPSSPATKDGGGGVLPVRNRRNRQRQKSEGPEPRRRVAIFGMFCVPTTGDVSPPASSTVDIPDSESIDVEIIDSTLPRRQQLQRSQSLPRIANSQQQQQQQQQAFDSADGRWTREDLHVPWHSRGDQRRIGHQAPAQQPERISYPLQAQPQVVDSASVGNHEPVLDILQIHGIIRRPEPLAEPTATPRTRSGFLAGMLDRLSTSSHTRRKSNAESSANIGDIDDGDGWRMRARRSRRRRTMADIEVEALAEPLQLPSAASERVPAANVDTAPNVDLCVPTESLSDEICAGIAHNAQDATLSSSGRRMYSEVLQSLRDPAELTEAPPTSANPTRRDTNGWRDSAITGFLTQTSAKDRTTVANAEALLQQQPGLGICLPPGQHVAGDEGGDDAHVLEPSHYKHVVRFEQKAAAAARTSSMDTITAAAAAKNRTVASSSRRMPQSMPQSRAMSSDDSLADSLADMLASDASEHFRSYRVPDIPGLESYAGTPVPANARLRRLEDEVLYGACRPATADSLDRIPRAGAMLASFDSPVSDAGTGRTQILDFAEADIRSPVVAGASQLQRRPSARPEIRDVRGILWADTNPTSTAAASADLSGAAAAAAVVADTPATLNSPERPATANASATNSKPSALPVPVGGTKLALDDAGLHNPLVLARLVHTSPDPRSLIYDAASQFGSMRSRPSFGFDPKPTPKPDSSLNAHPVSESTPLVSSSIQPDIGSSAVVAHAPALETSRQMSSKLDNESVSPSMPWPGTRTPDELSLHRRSRQFVTVTDSEALAHVSVQATMSGESPAMAAKTLSQKPGRDRAYVPPNGASGKKGERPMSLQEYVEQQKLGVHHRATPTGHEQLNFRVSLLERRLPEYNKKARSVSLPSPHSGLPALPTDILQPAISRSSQDRPIYIPRPAAHQRTKSFYDSPPLVQALLHPEWPMAASGQSQEQSLAEEELAERALFSHLLGDGAALTSPDLKVARRQSGAQSLVQAAPPLFDPDVDTGENGVPDSVLRAYLAGDLTAIERFFEHIMRITAPSSIYDGDVSEDGDWTFGLEGPPPEILAQREAARKELVNASREVPDMIDASAEASRIAASGVNLQLALTAAEPVQTSTPPTSVPTNRPDSQIPVSIVAPVDATTVALSEQQSPSPAAEAPADSNGEKAVDNETPVSNDAGGASKPARRIAIARSQLARTKREGLHNNSSGQSSSTNSADLSGHNCKTNTSISLTNSQRPVDDESRVQASEEPTSPWDDVDIAAAPSQTTNVRNVARFVMSVANLPPAEVEQPAQYDKIAACISPGRARSRNRRQSESGVRNTIIPSQEPQSDRRQERQMLMARLRVLETMIQKAAIEESRLQPPAVLRKSRLVEDVESIASIYSSSMEMDYERIYQELNNSQRPRADTRRKSADPEALRRSSEGARQQGLAAANQLRSLGAGQIPHGTARGEVLARLKQNSQARAMSPLRASMLGRATAYRPGERPVGTNSGAVANTSVLSEVSEVAYSARSNGSIRIDIVDEGSTPSLPVSDTSHLGRALAYQNSSRFRRTAKLLGS